jgi:hypothetical protein
MNAGVWITPWAVVMQPARAWPSVAWTENVSGTRTGLPDGEQGQQGESWRAGHAMGTVAIDGRRANASASMLQPAPVGGTIRPQMPCSRTRAVSAVAGSQPLDHRRSSACTSTT